MVDDGPVTFPANDEQRLAALRRYRIVYDVREAIFDRIADMARSIFRVQEGLIAFVDADRVLYKSGGRSSQLPRNVSFTAYTILSDEVLVIPDVEADVEHPIGRSTRTPIKFYAGAPLITRDGYRIGALCVTDDRPHPDLTGEERELLRTLAQLAMNELELRRELAARTEAERDLALMNRLMLAIAEAPDAREALDTSVQLISIAVGAVHGAVFEVVAHRETIVMIGAYAADPAWQEEIERVRRATIEVRSSLTGVALLENRTIVTDTREALKQFPQLDAKLARGSQLSITIPLEQSGRRFAFHFFFETRPPNPEELATRIVELAERVRPALARKLSDERIEWLQSMVLNADDAAILMMPDNAADPEAPLRVTYVNPAMIRMTGFSAEELTGRLPAELAAQAADLATLQKLQNGVPFRREMQWRRKDGTLFWADINAVAIEADASGGRRIVAMLRDTRRRRQLEQALREREQTFHLMFSRAPVPMMLLDVRQQRYVEVNDAAMALFGYSREQFLDMSAETIRAPDEIVRYREIMQSGFSESEHRGEWRYVKADGDEIVVEVAVHPFRFQDRAMAIVVTVDMTEQKRVEEQIRSARDAAEAVSRAKSDLLANMSHELRTPLNAIIGFSQIMREEMFGPLGAPRYGGYVCDILESAHHLLAVINDILDLAKIEARSWQIKEKEFALQEVVHSALRLVRPRADEAGIQLEFLHEAPGLVLFADETALKRILVNLLANAVKFSDTANLVTVACRRVENGDVMLSVVDRGIGMAPEEIPLALTPFQQVDIGLRRKYEGTGLGLPIAKQLAELHGGTLTIESTPGAGTTVTVALRVDRVVNTATADYASAETSFDPAEIIAAIVAR